MSTTTNNYGLTKPAWDELVDITVLNGNSDIIDAQMKANQTSATQAVANVAAPYDSEATYSEGDFCTYNNGFFVANQDITTPEAFDSTKWDATTASEHFGEGGGGNANERVLTEAEYNALTPAEQMNGTTYYLNDVNYSPVIAPIIYSDEEREVGVWRDGKPLYQRTFQVNFTISTSVTVGAWQEISDVDMTNVDVIVCGEFMRQGGDSYVYYRNVAEMGISSNAKLQIATANNNFGGTLKSITLQYTKTTDTAGGGTWTPSGVPAVHYSTDEQVVGTWIDGRTIYQKTVNLGNLPSNTTKSVPHGISDVTAADFINFECVVNNGSYAIIIPKTHDQQASAQVMIELNSTNIEIYSRAWSGSPFSGYATLRYTKTTD